MTARVVLSCNGILPSGMECRAALPTHTVAERDVLPEDPWTDAYDEALAAGWDIDLHQDLCPSCARRARDES